MRTRDPFRDRDRCLREGSAPSVWEGDAGEMPGMRLLFVGNVWEWGQGMGRIRSNSTILVQKNHGKGGTR